MLLSWDNWSMLELDWESIKRLRSMWRRLITEIWLSVKRLDILWLQEPWDLQLPILLTWPWSDSSPITICPDRREEGTKTCLMLLRERLLNRDFWGCTQEWLRLCSEPWPWIVHSWWVITRWRKWWCTKLSRKRKLCRFDYYLQPYRASAWLSFPCHSITSKPK